MANDIRITDFIGDIIDLMRQRGTIVSITNTPGTEDYVIVVDSLLDLVVENYVYIGAVEYQVRSIDTLTPSFTVSASAAPVGTAFKTAYPFYFHGRFIAIDSELRQIQNSYHKYPIIYLAESFDSTDDIDPKNQVGQTVYCSIFIMDTADYTNYLTEDHYEYVIDRMDVLGTAFVNLLKKNRFIQYDAFSEDDRKRHPKWGLEITNKGAESSLFIDNLSGIELRLTIPIRKAINYCGKYAKWKTKNNIS